MQLYLGIPLKWAKINKINILACCVVLIFVCIDWYDVKAFNSLWQLVIFKYFIKSESYHL